MPRHLDWTQAPVHRLAANLAAAGSRHSADQALSMFRAAGRLASAAMWLTVQMTYAKRVRLDGSELEATDFKEAPDGHTWGSLNMVPAYVGCLLANTLSGRARSWLMGRGHCVVAVEGSRVNVHTAGGLIEGGYLGFINRGGTLDTFGMLFANRCTRAHVRLSVAQGLGCEPQSSHRRRTASTAWAVGSAHSSINCSLATRLNCLRRA
jgi:phosphoketolase